MSEVKTKTEKTIDFYEFLRNNGFKILNRDELVSRNGYGSDYTLPVSSSDNTSIGIIYKTSDNPVEYGRIKITYYLNAGQVKEVLKLRDFLEKNKIPYTECGNKEIIAQRFRENAKELDSLADKLEGKV